MSHERHQRALQRASYLIGKLPVGTCFGVAITNEDDLDSPGSLNIYARTEQERAVLVSLLGFTYLDTEDAGDSFVSYRMGALLVSITQQEENT